MRIYTREFDKDSYSKNQPLYFILALGLLESNKIIH